MLLVLQFFVLLLTFTLQQNDSFAQYIPPSPTMVSLVHKHTDVATPLYSIQIESFNGITQITPENFLIDIDAPLIWHDCISKWNKHQVRCPLYGGCISPVSCEDFQCTKVRSSYSYKNPSCSPVTNSSRLPASGLCSCPVNVKNPLTKSCSQALLNYDDLIVNTANNRNSYKPHVSSLNAACAPSSSFESFPSNVTGVMALSMSPYAFQAFFMNQVTKRILALCLPSSSKLSTPGVLFYGDGPYYFHPHYSNVDIRSILTYTPLLKQPHSFGYFIGVNAIVIKQRSINIPMNATTKLSTIKAYTTLRTDIYNRVVRRFSKVTKKIPLAKPVRPFSLCYKTFMINGTRVVPRVPDISFSLRDGGIWTVSRANSIKRITKHVSCLAFVDGGATSEHAIVIGTFQFEDNLLVFDLENSTFGFSSSLLKKQTSCANFNFT